MSTIDSVNEFVRSRLRRLRLEKGLKVVEAAKRSGLPTSSYACLESGSYRISLDNLSRILRALEVDIVEVWPAEDYQEDSFCDLAAAKRTQVFRLNEAVRLAGAEGAALFKVSAGGCSLLYHQSLSDFLIDRILLYLEEGRAYEHGVWFQKERGDNRYLFFLKTSRCEGYVRKLIDDYMSIWAEIF